MTENIRRLFGKGILLALIYLFLYCGSTVDAKVTDQPSEVLVLHSYSHGLIWTKDEAEGIVDVLKESKLNTSISVEYLDWKNYPYEENLNYLYKYYKGKYAAKDIDIIITTDDVALEFALKYRSELFSNAPIVFCGVNRVGVDNLVEGYENVTGVIEEINTEEIIHVAKTLIPDLENLFIVYDSTESGISTGQLIIDQIREIAPEIEIRSINNITHQQMIGKIENLVENSAILLTTYYADINGDNIDFEQVSRLVSEASNVPMFHLYDFGLDNGAIGGCMLSGRVQGEKAAEIALRIIKGEKASDIPIYDEMTCRYAFDYEQLERFNIPVELISDEAEIINKPFSFIETYRSLVIFVVIIFVILVVFITMLAISNKKLKKADKEMQEKHEELTQIYEELTASEEEIKQQCDDLVASRESLIISEERYKLVTDGVRDLIWDLDMETMELYFSERWYEMFGFDQDEYKLTVESWKQLIHHDDIDYFLNAQYDFFGEDKTHFNIEYRMRMRNGIYKWVYSRGKLLRDNNGKPIRFAGSLTDITEFKRVQDKLSYRAFNDSLTGLPNRQYLMDMLNKIIKEDHGHKFAIFYINTDNFKFVNDVLGHDIGDHLLILLSNKLVNTIKNDYITIFRLGGDEFVVLLEQLEEEYCTQVDVLAQSILKVFGENFTVDDNTLHITCSIGVSIYPADACTVEELLKYADTAMSKAKEDGKNKYVMFEPSFHQKMVEQVQLEDSLRVALEQEEFMVYYQPQVNVRTNKISGFEALIRWNSPTRGFVAPNVFISTAEGCGLIVPLGEWILRKACIFMKSIHDQGFTDLHVSVNISIVQVIQDRFVEMIQRVLSETGFSADHLVLEITESILMESFDGNITKLNLLKDMGIKIALDDFGKGYSSLSYLLQLPIATLKIDKSFIDQITTEEDACITGLIVSIGHKCGLKVVAEGVEEESQLEYLKGFNCDMVQGYYFSRPLPEDQIYAMLLKEISEFKA